ncbi:hypothetical protein [Tardiphaga sp. vice278]|uniref:hypothetical protein n=1 Tax=Tardiphaga sp. vice278 TaxID=2592815 RepID=UPI00143DCFAF|nr:hypothetical protein [Tardiphaga sp. vice278]
MDQNDKRGVLLIIGAMLIAGALVAWGTVAGLENYLAGARASDPLAKAGGLNDQQKMKK